MIIPAGANEKGNTMKSKKIKAVYIEPADYFPKEIRKKYKLGEFAEPKNNIWIISSNKNIYDYVGSFAANGFIDWRHRVKFNEGDTVYVYCSKGVHKIKYKCVVLKHSMPFSERVDDEIFWKNRKEYEKSKSMRFARLKLEGEVDTDRLSLEALISNGLNKAPQGPKKISPELQAYIESCFNECKQ